MPRSEASSQKVAIADVSGADRAQRLPPPSPKLDWQLADLIDLEYLLEKDREADATDLAKRDHRFYQRIMVNQGQGSKTKPTWNRRWLFRQWLELRREEIPPDQPLPGSVFASAYRVIVEILTVLGVLAGAGAAANLLRYDGVQPVNVAAFLGWLVLAQLGLVLAAAFGFLLRRVGCLFSEFSFLTGLLRWLWSWVAVGLSRHVLQGLSAERRLEMRAFCGRIAGRRSLFGEVALWPLVGALQWFGICFNVGAILATVLLVVFSDRAFGWQSAVDFNATQIHSLVQTLAYPWTWFWPDGAPTLEQVLGSKIVLKEGIKQLATENLVSWWPFLCLCLLTYGFLPRLGLWLVSLGMGYGARQRLSFRHVSCDRLHERMTAPIVQTSGNEQDVTLGQTRTPLSQSRAELLGDGKSIDESRPAALLIPEDLTNELGLDLGPWQERISAQLPWHVEAVMCWPSSLAEQADCARQVVAKMTGLTTDTPGVILLEEAWQPPIAEKRQALQTLRHSLGNDLRVMVLLIGRPHNHNFLTAPLPAEVRLWERQLATLGDSGLRVEPWGAL